MFIERKFYSYHYLRFYFVVSIISSFGLSYILTLINWKILLPFTKTTLILVITSLLIFSPISRYMQGIKIMYYYLTSLNKYELFFSNKSKFEYNKPEELKLAQFVNSQMNINDYVCIIGMFNCKIHLLLKEHNYNSLTQSCFVYSNEGLVEYYNIQSKEIRKAKIILVNTSDQDFIVQPISSYNSLLNDTLNSNYIRKYFTKIDSIATYVVYKRNKLN